MFRVISGSQENDYFVTAGPRQQGGDCVLAGNFPVNTQVTIKETPKPHFVVSGITVNEGQLIGMPAPFRLLRGRYHHSRHH